MVDSEGPRLRVRPHLARTVAESRLVVLDLDGVVLDMEPALSSRSQAIAEHLHERPYRPRQLMFSIGAQEPFEMLDYLARNEADYAPEAEAVVARLELDAGVTGRLSSHLDVLLNSCRRSGRLVSVSSDVSEVAIEAALAAHGLASMFDSVAGRRQLDLSAFHAGESLRRTASGLGASLETCIFVSGRSQRIAAAREVGARCVGFECRRDSRKHLALPDVPVVSDLQTLAQAFAQN